MREARRITSRFLFRSKTQTYQARSRNNRHKGSAHLSEIRFSELKYVNVTTFLPRTASFSRSNFSLSKPEAHHEEKSTRNQLLSAFLLKRAASLLKESLASAYPAPCRACRPCNISVCSRSVIKALSSVNSLSNPTPPPYPRLEHIGIPAKLRVFKSLWTVLTDTEQYFANSFAVVQDPFISKKMILKRRSTCIGYHSCNMPLYGVRAFIPVFHTLRLQFQLHNIGWRTFCNVFA